MGINVQPHIDNYWNTENKSRPFHPLVRDTMSQNRWKQIHRYIHFWDLNFDHPESNRTARPHEKVDPLAKLLCLHFNATGSQQRMLLLMNVSKASQAAVETLSISQQSLLQLDSRSGFSLTKAMCLTFFGM